MVVEIERVEQSILTPIRYPAISTRSAYQMINIIAEAAAVLGEVFSTKQVEIGPLCKRVSTPAR